MFAHQYLWFTKTLFCPEPNYSKRFHYGRKKIELDRNVRHVKLNHDPCDSLSPSVLSSLSLSLPLPLSLSGYASVSLSTSLSPSPPFSLSFSLRHSLFMSPPPPLFFPLLPLSPSLTVSLFIPLPSFSLSLSLSLSFRPPSFSLPVSLSLSVFLFQPATSLSFFLYFSLSLLLFLFCLPHSFSFSFFLSLSLSLSLFYSTIHSFSFFSVCLIIDFFAIPPASTSLGLSLSPFIPHRLPLFLSRPALSLTHSLYIYTNLFLPVTLSILTPPPPHSILYFSLSSVFIPPPPLFLSLFSPPPPPPFSLSLSLIVRIKNLPSKCIVVAQFALKFELFSLNFLVTP